MYINDLELTNYRTYKNTKVAFNHRDKKYQGVQLYLPNVSVIVGKNDVGKTNLLMAIIMACFGASIANSGISADGHVRCCWKNNLPVYSDDAHIGANFLVHEQDHLGKNQFVETNLGFVKKGEVDMFKPIVLPALGLDPTYLDCNVCVIGYGSKRLIAPVNSVLFANQAQLVYEKYSRVRGVFEDFHTLVPFEFWLKELQKNNTPRFLEIVDLVNQLLVNKKYRFKGEVDDDGNYLFDKKGQKQPLHRMSSGYKALLGLISDLLYNIVLTCPVGQSVIAKKGIVLIDEIEHHLQKQWNETILAKLSKTLPHIQFIVTTQNESIIKSIDPKNVIYVELSGSPQSSVLKKRSEFVT